MIGSLILLLSEMNFKCKLGSHKGLNLVVWTSKLMEICNNHMTMTRLNWVSAAIAYGRRVHMIMSYTVTWTIVKDLSRMIACALMLLLPPWDVSLSWNSQLFSSFGLFHSAENGGNSLITYFVYQAGWGLGALALCNRCFYHMQKHHRRGFWISKGSVFSRTVALTASVADC